MVRERQARAERGEVLEADYEDEIHNEGRCNRNCCVGLCNSTMNWILSFVTLVLACVLYERFTGDYIPFIGETIGGAVEKVPKIDVTGLLDKAKDWGFDFDDIFSFDTIGGNTTAPGWRSKKGEGLQLQIANALTKDWHGFFYEAVSQWESGSQVLSLSTYLVEPDPECTPIKGVMKVCNADFGDTGWEGINEVMIRGKYIIASVAKMNEFYLAPTVDTGANVFIGDKRSYTMCHEVGHGFGLPHLDENFTNADLGSCMDYSGRPENNLRPSLADFDALNVLYGDDEGTDEEVQGRNLRQNFEDTVSGVQVERRLYYLMAKPV